MRLGVTSYAFTWEIGVPGFTFLGSPEDHPGAMTASALLDRASSLGVAVVQILDNLPLEGVEPVELQRLRAQADRLGLSLEVGTRGIDPQHLRAYLRVARILGSPLVRVVVDTAVHRPAPDEVVAAMRAVIVEYEREGVRLAVENHDRFECRVLLEILRSVDHPGLGICLDTVNSMGSLENPEVVVAILGPHAISLHVKDFEVRRAPHGMGLVIEGEAAGRGRLAIPWLFEELRTFGRDPNALLELWTPPSETLSATIAKERAWAQSSIGYLRTLVPH